jgi:2-methylcitrate dehydratase
VDTREDTVTGGRMVTRELAEWVAQLRFEDLPDAVVEEACRAFADYLGETLFVGATKPWGQAIAEFCARDGGQQPEATIIATGQKTLSSRAALANGMMALGFEYADFGLGGRPYPFAITAPLVLAEVRERSGRDLVLGIVLGYEVLGRVFRATRGSFTGVMDPAKIAPILFYVPSLFGTFGGAAGAARVIGLDAQNTNYALGLAAAFTGGTFQGHEEGAWQRSLNGGMASERAVTAALMAETGFKATEMGLEGVQGFAQMYNGGNLDAGALLDDLGESYAISRRWVKPYSMNLTLHAPVEALTKIMKEHRIDHHDIKEIDAAWQLVEPFLAKHKVSTVVSAQASLPFALSVAAVKGKVSVDAFTDETVADPEVQAMIHRTVVHQDEELFAKVEYSMPGRVTVRLKDGREFTDEVLYPRGNPQNPLSEDEFKAKFMDMAVRVLGEKQSNELYARARDLVSAANIADLTPLFSPA